VQNRDPIVAPAIAPKVSLFFSGAEGSLFFFSGAEGLARAFLLRSFWLIITFCGLIAF
jgi:hypothetical protein